MAAALADMIDLDVSELWPIIIAGALPYLVFALLGQRSATARVISALLCVLFTSRYLWWRWTYSLPTDQAAWQQAWAWIFLFFETMSNVSCMLICIFMSRTRSRSAVVDARPRSAMLRAPVDVFIATYNEEQDILERTITGAVAIDHPDLRVWVLDDGARPWVRELAYSLGAHYTFRVKGRHAKAGNVNHGLAVACATGRRPEFVLLLDADFVPSARILRRTLPLFEEADVGIVQTPAALFQCRPNSIQPAVRKSLAGRTTFLLQSSACEQGCLGCCLLLWHFCRIPDSSARGMRRDGDGDCHRRHADHVPHARARLPHGLSE